ncbi:Ig-like domain-containing protein [Paramagnetospirillum kuznetsovii]|uniref:Ig-like domain-containing protein n=1 Tax=Paramagnetospirillum kuznetsovii TaxID=2053833 RepID=UPI001961B41D|nr:tandem-95 repeat protein [Paramagnetospirillum kuznetsovii]
MSEDSASVSGHVSVTDADHDQAVMQETTQETPEGTFTMGTDGNWSFAVNADAVQGMAAGESLTKEFKIHSADGTEQTVTVTIDGANDAATISGNTSAHVAEDGNATATGHLDAADVDHDQAHVQASTMVTDQGTFAIGTDGNWSFQVNSANADVQALGVGESMTKTFEVKSADGTATQTVSVIIDGGNDAPTISGSTNATATDHGGVSAGHVTATDVDAHDTLTYSFGSNADGSPITSLTTEHGSVSINSSTGEYSFTPNAGAASLGAGAKVTDGFTVTVSDGHGGTTSAHVGVDITGSNDGPVLNVSQQTMSGTESTSDAATVVTGHMTATDVDAGDTLSYTVTDNAASGHHGSLAVDASGNLTFTATDNNWSGSDSFHVQVSDGHGGTTTQTVNLNVGAAADAPELSLELGTGSSVTLPGETAEVTITSANMLAGDGGFSVSAFKLDGSAGTLSSNQYGFGVAGGASGDSAELGQSRGSSEKIVVDFDNDVSTANVSFGWLAGNERAHYDLFKDGVKVGEGTVAGITDNVDPTISISPTNGGNFDQIVFSAPSGGDNDYMIHSISFQEAEPGERVIDYPLNVSSSLTDTDGSESLAVSLNGLPEGAVIMDASGNVVGTAGNDGTWSLPGGQIDGLTLRVPADSEGFTLAATATSTESSNQDSASTSVSVNVQHINSDPTVTLEGGTGTEDNAVTGHVVGADVNTGDTLGYHVEGGVSDGHGNELLTTDHGVVSLDTATGEYTFTPNANWAGNDSFSVTVSDGNGGSVTQSVAVHVDAVADQAGVSVAIGNGTVTPNGSFTVTNLDGEAGYSNTYGYYVTDASGNPTSGHVIWANTHADVNQTVTITGVDPDHVGFFIIPNGHQNGGLADNTDISFTKDASGNWQAVDSHGTVLSGAGANVLFDKGWLNSDHLTHTEDTSRDGGNQNWEDLSGGGDRDYNDTNVSVSWNAAAPTATHPLTVIANFPDSDGSEAHAVKLTNLPAGASLYQDGHLLTPGADGSYSVDPTHLTGLSVKTPAGFSGDVNVTVEATSAENGTVATASASAVSVHDDLSNHGPSAAATASFSAHTDNAIAGSIAATDADGNHLSFSLGTGAAAPQHGSVVLGIDGTFTYTPNSNYTGSDHFSVTVSDGHGGTTTQVVTVSETNSGPTLSVAPLTTADDHTAIKATAAGRDADAGDTVSYSLLDGSGNHVTSLDTAHGHVTINATTGEYTFTPTNDSSLAVGKTLPDSFKVVATDNHGANSDPATVNVTITGSNDGPVVSASQQTMSGTESTSGAATTVTGARVVATDVDVGDTLSYTVTDNAASGHHGALSVDGSGNLSFTASDNNWSGSDSFHVQVSDGHGGTATQTVNVNVAGAADQATVGVSIGAGTESPGGSFTVTNLDNTASAGYHNTYGYYVMDASGNPTTGGVIWADVHASPNAVATVAGVDPDRIGFFIVPDGHSNNASLKDGAALTFSKDTSGNWQAMDSGGHALVGTGAKVLFDNSALNSDNHLVHAQDSGAVSGNQNWEDLAGGGDRDYNDVNMSVVWGAAAPTSTHPLTVTANFPDMDGSEGHAVKLSGLPAGATLYQDGVALTAVNGAYTVDPTHLTGLSVKTAAGFNGDINVTVTATTTEGSTTATATATASVHDDLSNHGPDAGAAASGSTLTNTALFGVVQATDADGDVLHFALGTGTDGAQHGSVVLLPDGNFTYTPASNFVGTDSFKVTIADGHGGTTTETVSVTVAAPNHAPVIDAAHTTASVTVDYAHTNTANIGQVTATDVDGDKLTYTVAAGGEHHGSLVMDSSSGSFFYDANDTSWSGKDVFTVNVSDGHGGSTNQTITINEIGGRTSGDGHSAGGLNDGQKVGWGNGGGRDESWGDKGSWEVGGAAHGDSHGGKSHNSHGGHVTNATDDGTNWGSGWYAWDSGNPGGAGTGDRFSIEGDNRHNEVYKGESGDTLIAAGGNDYLSLDNGAGKQMISGYDHIQMGNGEHATLDMTTPNMDYGNLTVAGGTGHDVIWTASGNDLITAGNGTTTVHAGAGNDTIVAGAGDDVLMGQDGSDTFMFDFGHGHATVDGGAGATWTDTLDLSTDMHAGATITITTADHQSWTVASDGDHHAAATVNLGLDKAGDVTIHSAGGDETIHFTNIESIKY